MNRYCALALACVGFQRASEEAATLDGPGPLCEPCIEAGSRAIRLLALDYLDLGGCLPGRRGEMETKISGSAPRSRPPMDLSVEATQRDIVWTLQVWEPAVREAAGLSPERAGRVRDRWAVTEAVRILAPRVPLLAALPPTWGFADGLDAGPVLRDGPYAVAQFRELHLRSRKILGLTRRVVRLPGECSGCGAWALRRDDGSDTVYCKRCSRRWTVDDYHRYVGWMIDALPAASGGES